MLVADKPPLEELLAHISEKPWSSYTKADYTVEQWHRACLIHQHDGTPTSKGQCKLPVRTPNGAVNRNGVHAAAAALGGARGGVQASPAQISSAKSQLQSLYKTLGETAAGSLAHFGIKGMKWGQRKERSSGGRSTQPVKKRSIKKDLAIATGVVAGAATALYLLEKYGPQPQSRLKLAPITMPQLHVTSVPKPRASTLGDITRTIQRGHTPSPFEMHIQAGRAAQLNAMNRVGAQKLTDKAWRDAAKLATERHKMDDTTKNLLGNNQALLDAWNNPNHVWRL